MDKNDLPEEVLAELDVDLENLDEMLDDMEETREEETFKNWVRKNHFKLLLFWSEG